MFWIGLLVFVALVVALIVRIAGRDELGDSKGKVNTSITVLGILLLFTMFAPFTIITAGYKGVVVQLGAVKPIVLSEGIHGKVPIIQSIELIDCRIQKEEVDASAASKDLQQIQAKIAVNFRVKGEMAAELYKNVGETYPSTIIAPAIQESMKSITARYTAEELITKRQDVSTEVKAILDTKVEPYGIIIDNFNIVNFAFSETFNQAIEQKQTAQQNAMKAQNDLERVKYEAQQKVTTAQAEADALKAQKEQITPELLQLRQIEVQSKAIEKWNGVMPTYSGGNMPFIQIPTK